MKSNLFTSALVSSRNLIKMGGAKEGGISEEEEEIICLDAFFVNDDYRLTSFTFGSHDLQLYCLQSASTDFDLTGQLVWPGAMLMNNYLSENTGLVEGCSIIELGSGVGITGILCSKFCKRVVLTDHNDEVIKILKKNIELHGSSENPNSSADLAVEKLEWGNVDQLNQILKKHSGGFDLILGADICFQQSSVPLMFDTAKELLRIRGRGNCKFILAYVSRAKQMDLMVSNEAARHGMLINEVPGTRCVVRNLPGVVFELSLQ